MLPIFTPFESQCTGVARAPSSPGHLTSRKRSLGEPAKTNKRNGPSNRPTKKRVITSARREQNREAQRLYRQRQRELREKKKLEAAGTPSSSTRKLLPRNAERTSHPSAGGLCESEDFITSIASSDDHERVIVSRGGLASQPGSTVSSALILPGSSPSPAASAHADMEMSYWTSFWTSLAPQRAQVQSSSPSKYSRSTAWMDQIGSDIWRGCNAIRESTPGPVQTQNEQQQQQQQQQHRRRSPSPGRRVGALPSPYLNTIEFMPTTILSATLQNAIALGFDMTKLGYCRPDYTSPYYCPGATAADDLVETLRGRMFIQPDDSDQRGDYYSNEATRGGGGGGARLERYLQQLTPGGGFEILRFNALDNVPADLRPTVAQALIPHHASLDLIPIPTLRAQAILLAAHLPQAFDLCELKTDNYVRGGLVPWKTHRGRGGGGIAKCEPWLESSWEAKDWFLKKWSMAVGGEGADLWRQSRAWEMLRQTLDV